MSLSKEELVAVVTVAAEALLSGEVPEVPRETVPGWRFSGRWFAPHAYIGDHRTTPR